MGFRKMFLSSTDFGTNELDEHVGNHVRTAGQQPSIPMWSIIAMIAEWPKVMKSNGLPHLSFVERWFFFRFGKFFQARQKGKPGSDLHNVRAPYRAAGAVTAKHVGSETFGVTRVASRP